MAGSTKTGSEQIAFRDRGWRIHIFGASGSGTTTLGRALAAALSIPHLDTDHFYWRPTDPPFREKVPPLDRIRNIQKAIDGRPSWVLSGSLCSWGNPLVPSFTAAVFLYLEHRERMARLLERERARYGRRIDPGGDLHGSHRDFLAWASAYDTAGTEQRSRLVHQEWMTTLPCPVIRLDSGKASADLVDETIRWLRDRERAMREEMIAPPR